MTFAQRYRQLDDARLTRLALHEGGELTDAARAELATVLAERQLTGPLAAIRVFDAGRPDDVATLLAAVRHAPCPLCGAATETLNAAEVTEVRAFWGLVARHTWSVVVACTGCLRRAAVAANRTSLTSGLWSVPGLMSTPLALLRNRRAFHVPPGGAPTRQLARFVESHAAALTAAVVDPALMRDVLSCALDAEMARRLETARSRELPEQRC